jgi:hypothetical protein
MIGLLDVNTYASMVIDYLSEGESEKRIATKLDLESKLADRNEILNKLEEKASESGSDNSWNRYESAAEAYAYGDELNQLLGDYELDPDDIENIQWQVEDIIKKTQREWAYRMERAQW